MGEYRPCDACGEMIKVAYAYRYKSYCKKCFKIAVVMDAEDEARRKKGIPEDRDRGLRSFRI